MRVLPLCSLVTFALVGFMQPTSSIGAEGFLEGAEPLLRPAGPRQFAPSSPKAKLRWMEDGGILRIAVEGPRPAQDSEIKAVTPIDAAFHKGDVIFLSFEARCLETEAESGAGQIAPVVEMAKAPHSKAIWARFPVTEKWTKFMVPATLKRDFAAGELVLNFRLGYAPQVLELRNIGLWKLPKGVESTSLPITRPALYPGHEANAAWRKAAAERIEQLRKQDLKIVVCDPDGNPIPGIGLVIEQTRHAFGFGTAVSIRELIGNEKPADTVMYQSVLLRSFDTCGTENDLKWPPWEKNRDRTLRGLQWLKQSGFSNMRGHVLLWPSFAAKRTPDRLQDLRKEPEKLRAAILDHVRDITTACAPYIQEWDVINEPRLNHEILDLLGGEEFMVEVFQEARRSLPEGRLFLNEALNFNPDTRIDELERTAKFLLSKGAPLDGLGIQCHYNGWIVTPPEQILKTLDRLAALGKDIEVTEFDIDTTDDAFQARYLRDFYTAVFSHPAITGIQMWGFWAGRHWNAAAALWNLDWSMRPAARAYLDLVRGEWWTQALENTDENGTVQIRGFKGDYLVTTWIDETVVDVRNMTLGEKPELLTIQLADSQPAQN